MMRHAAVLALALSTLSPAFGADDGLKIYISADMEGVTGVVTSAQLGPLVQDRQFGGDLEIDQV